MRKFFTFNNLVFCIKKWSWKWFKQKEEKRIGRSIWCDKAILLLARTWLIMNLQKPIIVSFVRFPTYCCLNFRQLIQSFNRIASGFWGCKNTQIF